jgi:hypothetical protein
VNWLSSMPVLNRTLRSWRYKNGAQRTSARLIRSQLRRPSLITTTSPAFGPLPPPFLAYPDSWKHHPHLYQPSPPSYTARDTLVDAPRRAACPGNETRDKCVRVKRSDRIRRVSDPTTSLHALYHRTLFRSARGAQGAAFNCTQIDRQLRQ